MELAESFNCPGLELPMSADSDVFRRRGSGAVGARAHVREALARIRRRGRLLLSVPGSAPDRRSNAGVRRLCFAFQVRNGSAEQPYVNPRAPVHIITGSAVSTPVGAVSFVPTGHRTPSLSQIVLLGPSCAAAARPHDFSSCSAA